MASGQPSPPKSKRIPMIVDLAFATNVRFLDEHELHLDDVQLYKVSILIAVIVWEVNEEVKQSRNQINEVSWIGKAVKKTVVVSMYMQ